MTAAESLIFSATTELKEGFAKVKKAVEIVANFDLPVLAMESTPAGTGEKRKKKGGQEVEFHECSRHRTILSTYFHRPGDAGNAR
jgi:hypothetical protein